MNGFRKVTKTEIIESYLQLLRTELNYKLPPVDIEPKMILACGNLANRMSSHIVAGMNNANNK